MSTSWNTFVSPSVWPQEKCHAPFHSYKSSQECQTHHIQRGQAKIPTLTESWFPGLPLVHVKETDKTQRRSEQLCWMANTPISQIKVPRFRKMPRGAFSIETCQMFIWKGCLCGKDVYLERNDFFSVILYHLFTCMYHVLFTKSQSMFYQ